MIKKLASIAKDYSNKKLTLADNKPLLEEGFIAGFKQAFFTINQTLDMEKTLLKQYPIMGERLQAINTYQDKMNKLLKEMTDEA